MAFLSPGELPVLVRGGRYITLHLYLLSGEFIMEHVIPIKTCVERYGQDLEEGLVAPDLRIPNDHSAYYELVWNGMVLECGMKFEDLVEDHGMPVDEPVDITVIMKDNYPVSPLSPMNALWGWPA